MWKLDWCDIYRDQGSLGAGLSDGTKKVSLFLQVQGWNRPPVVMQYESLWVSEGETPRKHGEEILAGSEAERKWLWQLENNVDTDAADDNSKERFGQMVAALQRRNGGSA